MDSPLRGNQSAAEDERRRDEQRPSVGLREKNRRVGRGGEGGGGGDVMVSRGHFSPLENTMFSHSTVCMYKY